MCEQQKGCHHSGLSHEDYKQSQEDPFAGPDWTGVELDRL